MCLGKPKCHNCETCGRAKYQLWVDRVMHDRGCPFGAATMAECRDCQNHAGMLQWANENGVELKAAGIAFLAQMERAGAVRRTDRGAYDVGGLQ
jgi:hypothetical protein